MPRGVGPGHNLAGIGITRNGRIQILNNAFLFGDIKLFPQPGSTLAEYRAEGSYRSAQACLETK